ncbi:hypothetical protein F4804DRAFT_328281 [Jackrogersella minutella]|nr:hypothetical protein F4804DRAFT_328281 [Jackrogersella minutella]
MGGQAFSSGDIPLYTPRMPPDVYQYVLDQCCAKLRKLFVIVATPIPGPAKVDHGDIDILLTWERSSVYPSLLVERLLTSLSPTHVPLQAAARLLNAEQYIKEQPRTINLAIPWPENLPQTITNGKENHDDLGTRRYIQVDLCLCKSLEDLQWMLFKHAHGDIWSLLGSTVRPYGLTIDEVGLYMRIPEIEGLNRKQAKILLSTNPTEVLAFLGLKYDDAQWEEPFASTEDLFEYVATCRLFWVRSEQHAELTATDGNEIDQAKLKSNDRRRMNHRPVFRNWIEEFLPTCREAGRFTAQNATRESVRGEAFEHFLGTRHAYEARLLEWRKEQQRQSLWRDVIKTSLPEMPGGTEEKINSKHWRGHVASAFKKIIMQDDYSLGICPPTPLRDATGMYDEEKVRQFVIDSWRKVSDVVWKVNQK